MTPAWHPGLTQQALEFAARARYAASRALIHGIAKRLLKFGRVYRDGVVLPLAHEFKIFWAIVRSYPVDVMDRLIAAKRTAHDCLHNMAMLVNIASRNTQSYISVEHNCPTTLPSVVSRPGFGFAAAGFGAKLGSFFSIRINKKLPVALLADEGNLWVGRISFHVGHCITSG